MRTLCTALLATFSFLLASGAHGAMIVNTGPGIGTGTSRLITIQNFAFSQFTVAQSVRITTVTNGLSTATGGIFSYGIFAAGSPDSDLPGVNLFSKSATFSPETAYVVRGVYDLSWEIAAGTYWVGIAAEGSAVGRVIGNAQSPLSNDATYSPATGYVSDDDANLVWRISGDFLDDPSPTPEPATWAMMLVGFGVVGASMRRRRVATVFA